MLVPIIDETPPVDLDDFWKKSILELESIDPSIEVLETTSFTPGGIQVHFSFRGYKNQLLYGYYLMHEQKISQTTVVFYHGFNYHGGKIKEHLHWFNQGYAVITYDFRGQGGKSKDDFIYENGNELLMIKGVMNKEGYYLKHTILDSYQLYRVALSLHFVNPSEIIIDGFSQGGGIALIVSAFCKPVCICADVPSYSYFHGRYLTENGSVKMIKEYVIKHQLDEKHVLKQLAYFDLIHLSKKITSPVIVSVGLKDDICPAAYLMPSYDQIKTKKIVYSYPDQGHEGGGKIHELRKLSWVKEIISEHKGTTQ
jgi:cephalosporin-C deacetylase